MIDEFYKQPFPVLPINSRLFLREHLLVDSEIFLDYFSDPEVSRHILISRPKNIAESHAEITCCKNLFKNKQGIYWAIAHQSNNRMIGTVGLYINNQHHRAEIAYDLSRAYWNQGIMTEALRCVSDFSFQTIGLNRLEALLLKENQSSIRVLEKIGFKHEGHIQNYLYHQGKSHGVERFALVPQT